MDQDVIGQAILRSHVCYGCDFIINSFLFVN
jgi:hypothetical protein